MALRFRVPQTSSSSSEDEVAEYEEQRAARLQGRQDRQDRSDSPGWSDEPEATPQQLANFRAMQAEREQFFNLRMTTEDWCQCGNKCLPVQCAKSALDLHCCQETDMVKTICHQNQMYGDNKMYSCIVDHPAFFNQCLYITVLDNMAHVYSKAGHSGARAKKDPNKARRYIAIRQYTVWIHGRCGYQDRKCIPQCVTKKIKEAFPSADGYQEVPDSDLSDGSYQDDEDSLP